MPEPKLIRVDPKEGVALVRLSSGEEVNIFLNHFLGEGLAVRVTKRGIIGLLPGQYIWRLLLANKKDKNAVNGNMVYLDYDKYDPLQVMIGYVSRFKTIAELKIVANNHTEFFDAEAARKRTIDLAMVRSKQSQP